MYNAPRTSFHRNTKALELLTQLKHGLDRWCFSSDGWLSAYSLIPASIPTILNKEVWILLNTFRIVTDHDSSTANLR